MRNLSENHKKTTVTSCIHMNGKRFRIEIPRYKNIIINAIKIYYKIIHNRCISKDELSRPMKTGKNLHSFKITPVLTFLFIAV